LVTEAKWHDAGSTQWIKLDSLPIDQNSMNPFSRPAARIAPSLVQGIGANDSAVTDSAFLPHLDDDSKV